MFACPSTVRAAGWIAAAIVLANASISPAAVTEREVMDKITDNMAVMRHFYHIKWDAEYNRDMCRAAKDLTAKQLATLMGLLQAEKAKIETLEGQNLTRAEIAEVAKAKLDILQKQNLSDKDLKAVAETGRAKMLDLLKPNGLKEEDLAKQVQDEKTKLANFFLRRDGVENELFDAGKNKLVTVVVARAQKEKDDQIEVEKTRVRELLKRKEMSGKDLLAVENAMLDFLSRLHGSEERSPDVIKARGEEERAVTLQNRVDALQAQMRKLASFEYERVYEHVIAESQAKISRYSIDLDTRMMEYEALFGKKAAVEIAFESEAIRYHPKRENFAYFLNLN